MNTLEPIESEVPLNLQKIIPITEPAKILNFSNKNRSSDKSSSFSSLQDSNSKKDFSDEYIKELSRKIKEKTDRSNSMSVKQIEIDKDEINGEQNEHNEEKIHQNIADNLEENLEKVEEKKNILNQNPTEFDDEKEMNDNTQNDLTKKEQIPLLPKENSKNKPLNILKMIKHVSVALNKLRNRTQFRNLKLVTEYQTELINDYTWFSQGMGKDKDQLKMLLSTNSIIRYAYKLKIYFKKTYFFQSIHRLLKCFMTNFVNKIGVIEPDNQMKMIFDFIIIILIVLLFFIFPLQLSFNFYLVEQLFSNPLTQSLIYFIVLFLMFVDIILKFFTGYYENGISVLQKEKIIKNYLHKHVIFDLLAFLPVFLICFRRLGVFYLDSEEKPTSLVHLSEFLIFFKLFEVVKAIQTLEEMLHLNEQTEALFALFKLITKILLFCHILACMWHAVAFYSPYHENLISEGEELSHANWLTRYLFFLYWTISIEKIEPRNNLELFFGFFALLGSEAVMGIIIEGIHSILESLTRAGTERRESIKIINRYMRRKDIEYDVQVKVRKYLNFVYDQDSATSAKEHELIEKLSSSLREELLIRANGEILKKMPLFYKNFSEATLRKLVFSMKQARYYPEEIIFEENDCDDKSIYLIADGEVELYKDRGTNKHSIKKLKKGEYYGELSFFSDTNREFSCVSTHFSTVFVISRQTFIDITKEIPEDFEKFKMICDKMTNYQNYEDLYSKCISCKRNDHIVQKCPYIHFVPQREFLICRHLFNKPTLEREVFIRKKKRSLNSRSNNHNIQKKMKDFLASNDIEVDSDEFSDSDTSEDDDEPHVNSGVITSQTKINNQQKKSIIMDAASSGFIRNNNPNLSSVVEEVEKDDDEENSTHGMSFKEKEKNFERKVTSDILNNNSYAYENDNMSSGVSPKRSTIKFNIEKDREKLPFERESSRHMDREQSRKYSTYHENPNEMKTAISREHRNTRVQSGVYPTTSILEQSKNDLFIKDADKMTIFSQYFIHNNADNVIKNLVYKRNLRKKSTKYAGKSPKNFKQKKKKRESTKNIMQEINHMGLAIRMPSLLNENKERNSISEGNFPSPSKIFKHKKSFFTENDEKNEKK